MHMPVENCSCASYLSADGKAGSPSAAGRYCCNSDTLVPLRCNWLALASAGISRKHLRACDAHLLQAPVRQLANRSCMVSSKACIRQRG